MIVAAPVRFRLRIVTPKSLLVETEADEAQIPTTEGLIGVFPGHRPLVAALGRGTLSYRQAKYEEQFEVEGGYAEIGPDAVLIFTEPAAAQD
jgi:F-type H+-transporting ATPase subunit epsilon